MGAGTSLPAGDGIPDDALRSALELALEVARARAEVAGGTPVPAELRPLLRFAKVPTSALGRVRAAVEADPAFRSELAAAAHGGEGSAALDEIAALWLERPEGWREEIHARIGLGRAGGRRRATPRASPAARDAAVSPERAERRRVAAEAAAAAARDEVARLREQLEREKDAAARARDVLAQERIRMADLDEQVAELRRAVRHAADREQAALAAATAAHAERDEAHARAARAEEVRDAVLADRAIAGGGGSAGEAEMRARALAALQEAARAAQELAAGLGSAVAAFASGGGASGGGALGGRDGVVRAPSTRAGRAPGGRRGRPTPERSPVAVPGSALADAVSAATYLMRVAGVLVVVDGYNVAMSGWPGVRLEDQRERCVRALEDIARRWGTDIVVVFDGADVPGAHGRRRLVRVRFSPAGVTADDVVRAEVAGQPAARPVVVVSSDGELADSVRRAGANVVASDTLLTLVRR